MKFIFENGRLAVYTDTEPLFKVSLPQLENVEGAALNADNSIAAFYGEGEAFIYSVASHELVQVCYGEDVDAMFFNASGDKLFYHSKNTDAVKECFSERIYMLC